MIGNDLIFNDFSDFNLFDSSGPFPLYPISSLRRHLLPPIRYLFPATSYLHSFETEKYETKATTTCWNSHVCRRYLFWVTCKFTRNAFVTWLSRSDQIHTSCHKLPTPIRRLQLLQNITYKLNSLTGITSILNQLALNNVLATKVASVYQCSNKQPVT